MKIYNVIGYTLLLIYAVLVFFFAPSAWNPWLGLAVGFAYLLLMMNITEWLPVTATFSACLQNNHHHYSPLIRLSHTASEYDFGFMVVRWLKSFGLVKATPAGLRMPNDIPLQELGF
jgi:hypothetical protein